MTPSAPNHFPSRPSSLPSLAPSCCAPQRPTNCGMHYRMTRLRRLCAGHSRLQCITSKEIKGKIERRNSVHVLRACMNPVKSYLEPLKPIARPRRLATKQQASRPGPNGNLVRSVHPTSPASLTSCSSSYSGFSSCRTAHATSHKSRSEPHGVVRAQLTAHIISSRNCTQSSRRAVRCISRIDHIMELPTALPSSTRHGGSIKNERGPPGSPYSESDCDTPSRGGYSRDEPPTSPFTFRSPVDFSLKAAPLAPQRYYNGRRHHNGRKTSSGSAFNVSFSVSFNAFPSCDTYPGAHREVPPRQRQRIHGPTRHGSRRHARTHKSSDLVRAEHEEYDEDHTDSDYEHSNTKHTKLDTDQPSEAMAEYAPAFAASPELHDLYTSQPVVSSRIANPIPPILVSDADTSCSVNVATPVVPTDPSDLLTLPVPGAHSSRSTPASSLSGHESPSTAATTPVSTKPGVSTADNSPLLESPRTPFAVIDDLNRQPASLSSSTTLAEELDASLGENATETTTANINITPRDPVPRLVGLHVDVSPLKDVDLTCGSHDLRQSPQLTTVLSLQDGITHVRSDIQVLEDDEDEISPVPEELLHISLDEYWLSLQAQNLRDADEESFITTGNASASYDGPNVSLANAAALKSEHDPGLQPDLLSIALNDVCSFLGSQSDQLCLPPLVEDFEVVDVSQKTEESKLSPVKSAESAGVTPIMSSFVKLSLVDTATKDTSLGIDCSANLEGEEMLEYTDYSTCADFSQRFESHEQ
ncbi:uncharacterized protein V1518DRAFT_417665 [Limtongia smithiae]|uniref:uncharacterized protein n=1 Tax=Limtongia smithiae TaxID=1125753 RepID=UPI0034CF1D9A